MKIKRNRKKTSRGGEISKEYLPYPWVHYPGFTSGAGTFFAFSKERESFPYLCQCSKKSFLQYLKYLNINFHNFPFGSILIDLKRDLPPSILRLIIVEKDRVDGKKIKFINDLCYLCNEEIPSLGFTRPIDGNVFTQNLGWYIKQTEYECGFAYLRVFDEKSFPQEAWKLLRRHERAFQKEIQFMNAVSKNHHNLQTPIYCSMLKNPLNPNETLKTADKRIKSGIHHTIRSLKNFFESRTRKKFGYPEVGDMWVSETIFANIIKKIFPEESIYRHYRPKWLNRLELDVYIPSRKLAFEYQGQQHYGPIEAWGGESTFIKLSERDKQKEEICRKKRIRLFKVPYNAPLNRAYVEGIIFKNQRDKTS